MSARIHMSGSCDLQMLKDAKAYHVECPEIFEYPDDLDVLLHCLCKENSRLRTWDVSATDFAAIELAAENWNLNKTYQWLI